MANGDGGGSVPVRIIPPPPPQAMRIVSFALALLAAIAGFLGFGVWAGALAGLSFVFNLGDFLANRGVAQIPKSMLDKEGKLKVE
jgi:hypothetical protein